MMVQHCAQCAYVLHLVHFHDELFRANADELHNFPMSSLDDGHVHDVLHRVVAVAHELSENDRHDF